MSERTKAWLRKLFGGGYEGKPNPKPPTAQQKPKPLPPRSTAQPVPKQLDGDRTSFFSRGDGP